MSSENAALVAAERTAMAKVRGRVRREIGRAEEEEYESGELNIVPYLDILVNIIIFLLATISTIPPLANINVNSPRYEEAAAGATAAPEDEEKQALNLTIAISYRGFIVGGRGAVLTDEAGSTVSVKCATPLIKGRCPAFLTTRVNSRGERQTAWVDKYNYKALTEKMNKVKKEFPNERQVILTADRHIPYKVVVTTMDTLRGKPTSKCTGDDGCLFDQVILSAGVQ